MALQAGARRGDIVNLTWKSVHPKSVEFLETKEVTPRTVPLSLEAQNILKMLRTPSSDPDAFVFEPKIPRVTLVSRMRREWTRAQVRAGVAKIRFHDLRHTAGTRMVSNGVDLNTVKEILGHASLKTTERYLQSNNKLKQAAVETLSEQWLTNVTTTKTEVAEKSVSVTIQ